ncbi:MAG: polysaccharide pyruvyl transferase family protein [Tissierellia bacterium]|nr:polysaccharide pyruvyl transferase family protein [Tissierellia bacterium]MDD4781969.1 polysaccharide pyruvyl transferase family protein [Tissierellia bacterium]
MKKINLYWFRMVDGSTNYGDELNYFIINQLSINKIINIPYPYKWYQIPLKYFRALKFKSEYSDFKGVFRSLFASKVIFGIGSTIHKFNRKNVIVWGSGIIHSDWKINDADFRAVRGKLTQNRLLNLGYKVPEIIGDPALLLPLLINPKARKYKIGIIPHYIHYNEILNSINHTNESILINMKDDIHTVTDNITSCDFIISSSLHGLIVAQSFDIPALWVDFNCKNQLSGDNVKFRDYFSSVGIEPYSPISIKSFEISYLMKLKEANSNRTYIKTNLKEIQLNLLRSAPFTLKEKYKKLIS